MKQSPIIFSIFIFIILASCSSNEEPEYPVFMQPASIQTLDANGYNQTFEYDGYGKVIAWNCVSNSSSTSASYTAHYSYPDENTIKVTAKETITVKMFSEEQRVFEETIQLKNGRASQSEGTLIITIDNDEGTSQMQKTYRLIYDYIPTNHLNTVEHLEVLGIGDGITDNAWDNAWKWTNCLIWENGNLKEYQDFQGSSTSYQSTKFEYSVYGVSYPIIIPMIINNAHHLPLCMQGVFGLNSVNLVKSATSFDVNANLYLSKEYSYEFENARINKYTETLFTNSVISNPVTYTVNWTEK